MRSNWLALPISYARSAFNACKSLMQPIIVNKGIFGVIGFRNKWTIRFLWSFDLPPPDREAEFFLFHGPSHEERK